MTEEGLIFLIITCGAASLLAGTMLWADWWSNRGPARSEPAQPRPKAPRATPATPAAKAAPKQEMTQIR